MLCREQIAQLREYAGELEKRGAGVWVIGSGTVEQARAFAAGIPFRVLTDETLDAYRLAGFRHGWRTILNLASARRYLKSWRKGFRPGRLEGSATQQGGALVVAPGGRTLFHYVSRFSGDHPDPTEILRALPPPSPPRV